MEADEIASHYCNCLPGSIMIYLRSSKTFTNEMFIGHLTAKTIECKQNENFFLSAIVASYYSIQ